MTLELYNRVKCKLLKLNASKLNVLEVVFTWIMRNKISTNLKFMNNRNYQWFDLSILAEKSGVSYPTIKRIVSYFESIGLFYKYYDRNSFKLYLTINFVKYIELLNQENKLSVKRIDWINNNRSVEMNSRLFDCEEEMPKYCIEADSIARLILRKYPQYFLHRIPENGKSPTKTYLNICKYITDIYNGNFIKSRIYPLGDKFYTNKSFNVDGWQDKIKDVKGDWNKTRNLIMNALSNFELMHESSYMPFNKEFLQTNLALFFYDQYSTDEPQSQFIQCLFEPERTSLHKSEMKADRIFETLSNTAKKGGNNLFSLNTSMSPGTFWEDISKMVEWGGNLLDSDSNAQYWINSGDELPQKFYEYCLERKISVNNSTINIEKSVQNNAPWVWFIDEAIEKHNLNYHVFNCVTIDDFADCYDISVF